ncbi:bile-acid 7-alpha-dehydratase [Actinomadura sp. NBRC 104425]|uniref:nuclear transport factor 2 family protein n=1 Tax=Actinomadura sp. NBRC 104425 TaxID=3032204 RepID=UPI0024A223BC|nr:nuclear transport factor 2 family protein [Actinomadura sp. NBRC 104425]GLZ15948.1 bile-acid 7-alpha-dehydratase [Actinomadura sp. NBRC 104425]
MEESLEQAVERLVAIEEIRQLKARYFRAVDMKLWDVFADLFTEDLQIDFAESTSKPMTRDEFVRSAARHFEGAVSVHHGHIPEIEIIDDTRARAIWPMFDLVETPEESDYVSHTGYGHYTEEYRKENGRWKISRTRLTRIKRVVIDPK